MISVYITCKSKAEAKRIAKKLLQKRLIACANIFLSESMFFWKGKLNEQPEAAMLCKAKNENFAQIEAEVKKLHSYKVPCIIAFRWAAGSKEYAEWVKNA